MPPKKRVPLLEITDLCEIRMKIIGMKLLKVIPHGIGFSRFGN
jgi:hypothetical protein